jgi:hypothetical protein
MEFADGGSFQKKLVRKLLMEGFRTQNLKYFCHGRIQDSYSVKIIK